MFRAIAIRLPQRHASATALPISAAKPGGDAGGAVEVVGVVHRRQFFPVRRGVGWIRCVAGAIVGRRQPVHQHRLAAADEVAQLRSQQAGRCHCQPPGRCEGEAQASMGELHQHGFYGQCGHQKILTSSNGLAPAVSATSSISQLGATLATVGLALSAAARSTVRTTVQRFRPLVLLASTRRRPVHS